MAVARSARATGIDTSARPLQGAHPVPPCGELEKAAPALVEVAELGRLQAGPDLAGRTVGLQLRCRDHARQAPVVQLDRGLRVEARHPCLQLGNGLADALL